MGEEKITISMDEVNCATPVPGGSQPSGFTGGYVPPESTQEPKPPRTGLFIGIAVAVMALLCIAGVGIMALAGNVDGRTVDDFKAEIARQIDEDLSKPDSALKKFVEDAHLTVTVKSARIVRCDVTTVNGSESAGKDNANIDKVSMLVRFEWEGIVDKDGYTDLRIVYDARNDRLVKSEIEHTTALINVKDPKLWYGIGELLGATLL